MEVRICQAADFRYIWQLISAHPSCFDAALQIADSHFGLSDLSDNTNILSKLVWPQVL